jgi:hypothetical protein
MIKSGIALGFCLFLVAAVASAQNPLLATANRRPTSMSERLRSSECERMRWEAEETQLVSAVPNRNQQPDLHAIHIESLAQPSLTLPKLRREWLQPSNEVSTQSAFEIPRSGETQATDYLMAKPQKPKP